MKKNIFQLSLFFWILLVVPLTVLSQRNGCGTEITEAQLQYLKETREQRQSFQLSMGRSSSINKVPIQVHILRETDGSGGISLSNLNTALNTLNNFYANASIEFFQCNGINFIDDSNNYDFDGADEGTLCGANDVANVINIYFFNTVTKNGANLCGYAYFPGTFDRVIMDNSCAMNGSTLAHELGHYFSLMHTHGPAGCTLTTELVDGSNCTTDGDQICDTPADPNLTDVSDTCNSYIVDTDCNYTGTATDANGDTFSPSTENVMSYSRKACRTALTSGQYSAIAFSLINDRDYLCCTNNLATMLSVTQNISGMEVHKAQNGIYADNNVYSSACAIYSAGSSVFLNPGFHAYNGSYFHAYNSLCGDWNHGGGGGWADFSPEGVEVAVNHFQQAESEFQVSVSPNPFSEKAVIAFQIPNGNTEIAIALFSLSGKLILEPEKGKSFEQGNHQVSISGDGLPAGVYFCQLKGRGICETLKIVKK